jgi:putative DNA primase/helicase
VYRQVEREDDAGGVKKIWMRFGSELNVMALTRNDEGEDWGRLLSVVDRDGVTHTWAMPSALLAGSGDPLRSELFRLGFELEPRRDAKAWLLEYLITSDPEGRARCVSRVGWHGENYVLPDGPIGSKEACEQVILQTAEKPDHAFNVSGTLQDWQTEVAAPALGNSRLLLAISAGFAAPLLALAGDDGGGFHLSGGSSIGKSTALIVAGSVWGGGGTRGYKGTWRATSNAMEGVALAHCDCLLALDEIGEADPRDLGEAVYMLGNGLGKGRMSVGASLRQRSSFRVLFLSTGEGRLVDRMKEGGKRPAAGMETRLVSIRADAGAGMGIFEDTHGAVDPATFAQRVKKSANTHYGTAGRAFVAALVDDLAEYREQVADLRRRFTDNALPPGADGQVRRVADRFALLAAAGEIATALNLTGWPAGAALSAAQRCFADWLAERGGVGSSEVAEAKRRIAETLQLHGSSRFQRWAKSSSDRMVITNRMGFVKIEGDADIGETESTYFFMVEPLKEILAGLDFRSVVTELQADGVIVDHNGKPNKVFHVSSGGGKHLLYQINRDILDALSTRPALAPRGATSQGVGQMKTEKDMWADDLEQIASLIYALTQPEIFAEYDKMCGRETAISDFGLALHSIIRLFAAKARSEGLICEYEKTTGQTLGGPRNE